MVLNDVIDMDMLGGFEYYQISEKNLRVIKDHVVHVGLCDDMSISYNLSFFLVNLV